MKIKNKNCAKCGSNNWQRKQIGFQNIYQCHKCKYIFDWVDYTTVGTIDASALTTFKIADNSIIPTPKHLVPSKICIKHSKGRVKIK